MDIPIQFPAEKEKIAAAAKAFRRLTPDERMESILQLISLGASIMKTSSKREEMGELRRISEEAWKRAQRELIATHGN